MMDVESQLMNDNSESWKAEIVELSTKNAAKVLGIVLGVPAEIAADKLLEEDAGCGPFPDSGFQQFLAMGNVLLKTVRTTSRVQSYRTGISAHAQFADKFPTLGQWLLANPRRLAILRSGEHFIYVGWGMRMAGAAPSKGRLITHVIFLDEELEDES